MADTRTIVVRGLTVGDGTDYPFAETWITGLGVPQTRTADQERGVYSGDVGGDDVLQKRVLVVSCAVDGREQALFDSVSADEATWSLFEDLKTAWAPSYVDIPLVVTFAGVTLTYNGRPRGLDADVSRLCDGVIRVLLTFEALNPYAVGAAVDVAVGSP